MRGVTWMAADADVHNTTLFALWRTYASLDPNTGADSRTALTPPTPKQRAKSANFNEEHIERTNKSTDLEPRTLFSVWHFIDDE